jgi:DNA repair photolyase
MYPWVSHTHSHLGGECPHRCSYCYVDSPRWGRPERYKGPLRLIESEFNVKYGTGKTIFIENCNDLFAADVPDSFVRRIMAHCSLWPENTYVFQTKNPGRYTKGWGFPPKSIIGTTIETNRDIGEISRAPSPTSRALSMLYISGVPKFVTIEPVLDFDTDLFAALINGVQPFFVNLGADSKGHNLPEPTVEKIMQFTEKLKEYGIELREKHNLQRLKP